MSHHFVPRMNLHPLNVGGYSVVRGMGTGLWNFDHGETGWDFDHDGRKGPTPSPFQTELPFDRTELDVVQLGSLAIVKYRGRVALFVRAARGTDTEAVEADDDMLAEVAAGLARRVA